MSTEKRGMMETTELTEEHDVDIKKKKITVTKSRLFLVAVVVLVILLLVVCITLAVLYSKAIEKSTRQEAEKPGKRYQICKEDLCFDLGKEIVHNMNHSVDPCQDFYAYACGGWQKRHPLKKDQTSFKPSKVLAENNLLIIKEALEKVSINYSKNVAVMKTARFYNSCIDTSAIESQGFRPLFQLVTKYGGSSVTGNYNPNVSIATRIVRAAVDLGVVSLFTVLPMEDKYNSSNKILMMLKASLTFDRENYLNSSYRIKAEKIYRAFTKVLGRNDSYAKLMAIYDFEVQLAKISSGKTPEEELDEFVTKNIRDKKPIEDLRMTINDFCNETGFSCQFLKELLSMTYGKTFSGNEKMLVTNVTYFKNLYSFYKKTVDSGNANIIADYIMGQVVQEYLGVLPSHLTSSIFGNSSSSTEPRWKSCIDSMMRPFDMTLALLYVNAKFDDRSKKTMEIMADDIRTSFIDRLSSQTWMDRKTREKAKEKALAIRSSIGYPTYIKNPKKLEERYKGLIVTNEYFNNVVSLNHFDTMKLIKSYWEPVDKEAWPASPIIVNGMYLPSENRIIYYAGILQPPYFNVDYPRYMQYGGIGMVIGHEITHGFDGTGRKYDKNGNLKNWWSDSADANFKEKSSCLVKQYDQYKVFGKKINGTFTLDENIADNGGMKIAYDAYQRWAAQNGTEKILPGLELNPDQLFFLGFAQTWCTVYSKEGALRQMEYDPHSNERYRVIGTLSNFDKFSKAFKCPTNSPMNPETKCAVW